MIFYAEFIQKTAPFSKRKNSAENSQYSIVLLDIYGIIWIVKAIIVIIALYSNYHTSLKILYFPFTNTCTRIKINESTRD